MHEARRAASAGELAGLISAAVGSGRQLRTVIRLPGSSKKGVYRAVFADNSTAIVYVWDATEDYWPAGSRVGDYADPFSHASGLALFQAAQERLSALGVRTPQVYLADASREHYPADVAVLEDVPGPTLEDVLRDDPRRAEAPVRRLADALRVLHADKAPSFGKVLHVDSGGLSHGSSCEQLVLERALDHLAEAATRDERIKRVASQAQDALQWRAAAVLPRSDHSLIHGELGPDHVVLDGRDQPVIVDIEGLMYFDVEWEHVFLRLRFGRNYDVLHRPGLDQDRLKLYLLAMHLSLVAGPLRLLDGDYPERQVMLDISEYNLQQVLVLLTDP